MAIRTALFKKAFEIEPKSEQRIIYLKQKNHARVGGKGGGGWGWSTLGGSAPFFMDPTQMLDFQMCNIIVLSIF